MNTLKPYHKYLKTYSRENRTSMTPCEVILWKRVKGKQIFNLQFYRQKPLLNYIVDFYCPRVNLIIEVDGSSHDESKYDYDIVRQSNLEALGLKVLRFSDEEVKYNLEGVLNTIYDYCEENLPNSSLKKRELSNKN